MIRNFFLKNQSSYQKLSLEYGIGRFRLRAWMKGNEITERERGREMRWRMNEWPEEMIIGKRIGSKFVGASFVSREKAQWDIQAKQKIKNKK
jgi:hypothetical protein